MKKLSLLFLCMLCVLTFVACTPNTEKPHEHTAGAAVRENDTATCTQDGICEWVIYCTKCNAEMSRGKKKSTALGHDYVTTVSNVSKTEDGYTKHACSRCGDTYYENIVGAYGSEGLEFEAGPKNAYYIISGIGTCTDTHLYIPSEHEGKPVTKIKREAFAGCTDLKEITFSRNIESVDRNAFKDCTSLERVHIRDLASWCNIQFSVGTIMSTTWGLGNGGATVNSYSDMASNPLIYAHKLYLEGQELTDIVIPDGIEQLTGTFTGFTNLKSLTFRNGYMIPTFNFPFEGCSGYTCHVEDLAHWCKNVNLKYLNSSPFYRASEVTFNGEVADKISIPRSAYTVGVGAFAGISTITEVKMSDSITAIGDYAFFNCVNIKTFNVGSGVTKIGKYIFGKNVVMESLTLPFLGATVQGNFSQSVFGGGTEQDVNHLGQLFTPLEDPDLRMVGEDISGKTVYYIPPTLKRVTISGGVLYNSFLRCSGIEYIDVSRVRTTFNLNFYYCTDLKEVKLSNYSNVIGTYEFTGCLSLRSIVIPKNVKTISDRAFKDCPNLQTVSMNDSALESIGKEAFANCIGLNTITLPKTLTSIGEDAFINCYKLVEVRNLSTIAISAHVVAPGYVAYYAKNIYTDNNDSNLVDGDFVFYNDKSSGKIYLVGYKGTDTEIALPSNYDGKNYEVYDYAFSRHNYITSITIPETVTFIGNRAFVDITNLNQIIVAQDNPVYKSINGCLYTKDGKKLIQAALGLGQTEVVIADGTIEIGDYAFKGSAVESVNIPLGVTTIGAYAFADCANLKSVTLPSSLTEVGIYAFTNSALTSVDMSAAKLSVISNYMFYGCLSLENVKISSSTTNIGKSAFMNCSALVSIDFGSDSHVAEIGESAFQSCVALTEIVLPSSVSDLGVSAFALCSELKSVQFAKGIRITSISEGCFRSCGSLTTITIPSSVKVIGTNAFNGCRELQNVKFETNSSLTEIGKGAFSSCIVLKNIVLPSGLRSIGEQAFAACALEKITIPSSVNCIGASAFGSCRDLTEVTFENKSGWQATLDRNGLVTSVDIEGSELSSAVQAATLLRETYRRYEWRRSDS